MLGIGVPFGSTALSSTLRSARPRSAGFAPFISAAKPDTCEQAADVPWNTSPYAKECRPEGPAISGLARLSSVGPRELYGAMTLVRGCHATTPTASSADAGDEMLLSGRGDSSRPFSTNTCTSSARVVLA